MTRKARRSQPAAPPATRAASPAPMASPEDGRDDNANSASFTSSGFAASNLSLHELFAQQAQSVLARSGLDEEQKAALLVALSCPCCGAGNLSFRMKLKTDSK